MAQLERLTKRRSLHTDTPKKVKSANVHIDEDEEDRITEVENLRAQPRSRGDNRVAGGAFGYGISRDAELRRGTNQPWFRGRSSTRTRRKFHKQHRRIFIECEQ